MFQQILMWLLRSAIVGVGYVLSLTIIGAVFSALGIRFANTNQSSDFLFWQLLAGIVIGLVLGPLAERIVATRFRHLIIWTCVIFFNIVSVMIEGTFFAPERMGGNLPALVVQQFILAFVTAALVTFLFARQETTPLVLPARAWYDWLWRFIVSALSYLVFYFIFGATNYALVTKPYYETHAGGLVTPAVDIVLTAETIRAVLIVLSVLPFLLTITKPRRERVIWTGILLFTIGGIVPLLFQVGALPAFLLVASAVEIFFQNFSTGVVTALLLGRTAAHSALRNEKDQTARA